MTRALLRPTLFFATLVFATAALAAQKNFDRSFDVPSGGQLRVEADGGTIVVTGTEAKAVAVRIQATGDAEQLDQLKLSADRTADGVHVVAKRNKDGIRHWFGNDSKILVTVEVPRSYNLDLQTSGGDIRVKQINGVAAGRTSGGRVTIDTVQGEVRMKTSGGSMDVRNVQGPADLDTSGGSITAHDVRGRLRAHTSGGSIRLDRVVGAIDAATSGGSINMNLSGENEGVVAKTSGGSISLRLPSSSKANVNASTSGGRVTSDLPLTTSDAGKTSLRGTLNGGGPEILARTSGGSIQISGT